jgi:hypothetical protein
MGITDTVAEEHHAAPDVFTLAERIFPLLLEAVTGRVTPGHEAVADAPPARLREATDDDPSVSLAHSSTRGVLSTAPLVLLLVLMELLGSAGWSSTWVLAMSFGASVAMLVTAGPVLATGRRSSIYLGLGHDDPARRFTAFSSGATIALAVLVAVASYGALAALGRCTIAERNVFAVSIVCFAVVWVVAASLSVSGYGHWVTGCFVLGLGAGTLVGLATVTEAGIAFGYVGCLGGLLLGWHRAFVGNRARRLQLPLVRLLAIEATPYAVYGCLLALLFIEPHVLGWVGESDGTTIDRLRVFELSFLLALLPVLVATGMQELAMEGFWLQTERRKTRSPGRFADALSRLHHRMTVRYAVALTVTTLLSVVAVEAVVLAGGLRSLDQVVFLAAVGGAGLMGLGQFHCLLLVNLGRPGVPVAAAACAVATVAIVGAALASVDYRLAAVAWVVGGAVFAGMAWVGSRQLITEADHRYATAF